MFYILPLLYFKDNLFNMRNLSVIKQMRFDFCPHIFFHNEAQTKCAYGFSQSTEADKAPAVGVKAAYKLSGL